MFGFKRLTGIFIICLILVPAALFAVETDGFNGKWELVSQQSTEIDLWRTLSLEMQIEEGSAKVIRTWGRRRSFSDTLNLTLGGTVNRAPIQHRVWPTNVFMGVSRIVGAERQIRASMEGESVLKLTETCPVRSSQGKREIESVHTFRYNPAKDIITYTINRVTREENVDDYDIRYAFKRQGARHAYIMEMENNWYIDGMLPEQAMLISLQGLANQDGPQLYFIYPESWDYRFTPEVKAFLESDRYYTFDRITSAEKALETFQEDVEGYVVWDKEVRTSLIVAFTVAGLEDAIVVSEEQIPMVEEAGLARVEDFRGTFTGMSDAEIYQWAYDQYWDRCNKEYIIWMGGEGGSRMKPGVADWGIYKNAFFNDLSTKIEDEEEYALADKLLSEMKPMSMVMGWHSYAKDKERDHVTLVSSHGHRVEGLHTLPNMSFSSQIPPSPDFEFENNHNVQPGKTYVPEDKVYISCIQTDCLGLGAWTRPGRGEIPYAWEVTMNWVWLAPAMMEYFYTQATPNDYFIGSLSGPGYIYPKAVPEKKLPQLIDEAERLMKKLDLNAFEIMDYSQGATVEGNTELTKRVVDDYYQGMPDAIGFVNGYTSAYTYTVRNGRPLISYDYYLSPERPANEAVKDLRELASVNDDRPYFLLMHVRQWSDISRVKGILDSLGPEYEVVPLDIFLKMAGQEPTFEEYYLREE